MIEFPGCVAAAIHTLESAGFQAYAVGGCVRDSLLGQEPNDWDITTNALPGEVTSVFANRHVIPTGIAYGTVTVLFDGQELEITTYRRDGTYTDARRPDGVYFCSSLEEDLRRRDFTINAMAAHPDRGIVDPFQGVKDLSAGIIRCVGAAHDRFSEDALRILRALRFAAGYGFSLEPETGQALMDLSPRLTQLAAERVTRELLKLLCGKDAASVVLRYHALFDLILPGISGMAGFSQQSPYHDRDLLAHTADALSILPPDPTLRLAMLLHDIGKPACFTIDEQGNGHFYGHARIGAEIAEQVCRSRLRLPSQMQETVIFLINHHMEPLLPDKKLLRRHLNRFGSRRTELLLEMQRADLLASAPNRHEEGLRKLEACQEVLDGLYRDDECFSLKKLALNGTDLIEAGIPEGKRIGQTLRFLLEAVIDERCPNEKTALFDYLKQPGSKG